MSDELVTDASSEAEMIRQVMLADRDAFWTVAALAGRTGLEKKRVREILCGNQVFRGSLARSPKTGAELFALVERPVTLRERLAMTHEVLASLCRSFSLVAKD